MKKNWKLYIDAKFYVDHEYAIYFISKVNFTKVIIFRTPHKCTAIRVHFNKGIDIDQIEQDKSNNNNSNNNKIGDAK